MEKREDIDRALAIKEEKRNIRRLQLVVDLTTSALYQDSSLSLDEAREMIRGAEKAVLSLFPDKQTTFDIVLLPRFERILYERWGEGLDGTVH